MKEIDFLVVGQGLAGSILSLILADRGASVIMMGEKRPGSATQVSSGVINPITGRRFVKSWNFEELRTEALACYSDLEKRYGKTFVHFHEMLVGLSEPEEENGWLSRQSQPEYVKYCLKEAKSTSDLYRLDPFISLGKIPEVMRVGIAEISECVKDELEGKMMFERSAFDFTLLEMDSTVSACYGNRWKVNRSVIFCEGFGMAKNPYFNWIPFSLLKGEMIIFSSRAKENRILNSKYSVVPFDGHYWLGSNYDKNDNMPEVTTVELKNQLEFSEELLKAPVIPLKHDVGIRLASRDRRPFLGRHPAFRILSIFNGFGTKGTSLVPICARQMADFLLDDIPIMPEIDVKRFEKSFYRST